MTKQQGVFKGRVKRLLKEQKDMGQVGEQAAQSCVANYWICAKEVAAIEAFVHDLGRKLKAQVESQGENAAITPVELKQVVMAHPEFAFLQEKVASIDESDAKYHKSHAKKKKKATVAAAAAPKAAKKRSSAAAAKEKKVTMKAPMRAKKAKAAAAEPSATADVTAAASKAGAVVLPASAKKTHGIEIEEDDNYDESDSE